MFFKWKTDEFSPFQNRKWNVSLFSAVRLRQRPTRESKSIDATFVHGEVAESELISLLHHTYWLFLLKEALLETPVNQIGGGDAVRTQWTFNNSMLRVD